MEGSESDCRGASSLMVIYKSSIHILLLLNF